MLVWPFESILFQWAKNNFLELIFFVKATYLPYVERFQKISKLQNSFQGYITIKYY